MILLSLFLLTHSLSMTQIPVWKLGGGEEEGDAPARLEKGS